MKQHHVTNAVDLVLLTISAIALLLLMSGCATSDYGNYLKAQAEANKQAMTGQKPLLELTAQPGQPITGLASLRVYAPSQMPVIQQARPNEWAAVVERALGVAGTVGAIHVGGQALTNLAGEVRAAGTAGYAYVQAPVTTTTMSGTGVLGSGTYGIDQTHTPTIVTQPAPVVVQVPASPVVQVPPGKVCVADAGGVLTCQ